MAQTATRDSEAATADDGARPRRVAVILADKWNAEGTIDDAELFVIAAINKRPGPPLDGELKSELVNEGVIALVKLYDRYQPGFGGRDPEGSRFSGYAARYLPGKLEDALHKLKGDSSSAYEEAQCPHDSCDTKSPWRPSYNASPPICKVHDLPCVLSKGRRWTYAEAESLDGMADVDPEDGPGLDTVSALHSTDETHGTLSATMERLGTALDRRHARERSRTIEVAELLAEGNSPQTVATMLGIRHSEVEHYVSQMRLVASDIVSAA